MKNPELFNKTISILVNAYQNDTLEYTDCAACAVGNIVAGSNSVILGRDEWGNFKSINCEYDTSLWSKPIDFGKGSANVMMSFFTEKVKDQVLSTGYDIYELAEIEKAFFIGTGERCDNFNGLMVVCDCLMIIHEATESEITESKSLFIKQDA